MNHKKADLKTASNLTLEYYNSRADDFWIGTRDHDVSQNITALLQHIEGQPPFSILDLGCGPGRDLKTFSDLGHSVIGLEGSTRFAAMAREQGLRYGSRIFWSLPCRTIGSMGYSLMPRYSMSPAKSCRGF